MILPKDSTWQENLRCTPVLHHLPSVGPKQLCASVGHNTLKSLYKMKIDMELLCLLYVKFQAQRWFIQKLHSNYSSHQQKVFQQWCRTKINGWIWEQFQQNLFRLNLLLCGTFICLKDIWKFTESNLSVFVYSCRIVINGWNNSFNILADSIKGIMFSTFKIQL